MKVTDEQLVEGLEENGHKDVAQALAEKLREEGDEAPPKDMNAAIRSAAGRGSGR